MTQIFLVRIEVESTDGVRAADIQTQLEDGPIDWMDDETTVVSVEEEKL